MFLNHFCKSFQRSLYIGSLFKQKSNTNFYNIPLYFFSKNKRNDEYRQKLQELQEDVETISIKDIVIPRDKIETNFSRSSGPGGQNVNKLNTKAEIRFKVGTATWLTDEVKEKVRELHRHLINNNDELIVTCQAGRTQSGNLEEAFKKMRELIFEASQPERERKNIIPAETQREEFRRVNFKKKRSDIKKTRSGNFD